MGRLISTIAVVVILAALGGYIYFVDWQRPATGVEEKEDVFAVEADAIEEISLTSGGDSSTLRKTDGRWRMTAPAETDADQTEASSLASTLASIEVNRVVEENAGDLAAYGLATPRISVAFKAQGGASGALQIGDSTATRSDVYARKPEGGRVFLIPAYHESSFAKKPFDLRDKRILSFERDQVDSIEVAHDGTVVQVARNGSEWVVKQPFEARGDYSAIEGLITKLASTSMTTIVGNDPAALGGYGLARPGTRVTVGAGSARATLAMGAEADGAVYAQDQGRGLVFTIDPTVAADLKKGADEYRDKDLFEFRNFNVARLRITRGAETHELQKIAGAGESTDKWQRVDNGAATDLDAAKMDDFVAKLTALRAQSFVAAAATTGLASPTITVSASYDGGKFERVRMARTAEAFAARDGEPGAAKLEADAYDEVIKALDAALAPPAPAEPAK